MLIEDIAKMSFSETGIPDIFFSTYILLMPPASVRLYVTMIYMNGKGQSLTVQSLSAFLQQSETAVKNELSPLIQLNLVRVFEDNISLVDIRKEELRRILAEYEIKSNMTEEKKKNEDFVVEIIIPTFYPKGVNRSTYLNLLSLLDNSGFERPLFYQLFVHCQKYNHLDLNYVKSVARQWQDRKYHSCEDKDNYEQSKISTDPVVIEIVKFIQETFKLSKSHFIQEKTITKWVYELGYGIDIIRLASAKIIETPRPIVSLDRILSYWHKNDLKTIDDIKTFEENKDKVRIEKSAESPDVRGNKTYDTNTRRNMNDPKNPQNFETRKYIVDKEKDEQIRRMIFGE